MTLPKHFRSSRLRIGVAFSSLALVLFAAVGVLSGEQARDQAQRDAGAAIEQLADRLAFGLDAGLAERFREIQNLANLENLFETRLEPERWRAMVDRLQSSFPYYSWIGVARPDGTVVAGTQGLLEGRDVSKRPWFAAGLQRAFTGDVHEAMLLASLLGPQPNGEPLRLVDFAAPLFRDGRVEGVIGAHLTLAWVQERRAEALKATDPANRVEISIHGPAGTIMGPAAPAVEVLRRLEVGPAIVEWSDGKAYLSATARAGDAQGKRVFDWTIVARQPVDTALAPAERLRSRIWALGLLATLLFGIVGWWLAGRLTAPLRAVAQQAARISAQRGGGAAPADDDEVEQLAASLGTLLTHLREREHELVGLNASLEARVAQRTGSLNQANEDLRSFSHSVSHDLKGPIGSIGLVLRHLVEQQGERLDAGTRRLLGEVVRECDRLRRLTDELLSLALVEQSEMTMEPVSMQALVDEVVAELRRPGAAGAAEAERAELVVHPLPEVHGDAVLLRQVWLNLIANALKFSAKAAQPRVELQCRATEAGHEFSVADNGAGFDMSQAGRLFGTFQRLHRASDFPGTGVGLSIVKRVVHRHGGSVWAEGRPGEGARFAFVLPRRPASS
ncbi:MAG TPA: ATP-binding protein [Methylibium sp.]|uniref:sensor histidine kinase n=1 Tax=Methylibium sp. TaxID=2067992 RepID=UPI002DBAC6CB|nr:ATP-binding protein [Methylibium sp.]HEU4459917.1 ATP-binding protein [Methylibium sp.]